jgi:hypothetical protein
LLTGVANCGDKVKTKFNSIAQTAKKKSLFQLAESDRFEIHSIRQFNRRRKRW